MRRLRSFILMLTLLAAGVAMGQDYSNVSWAGQDSAYQEIEILSDIVPGEDIYDEVDEMPQFPGGLDGLMEFLNTNVTYPPVAAEQNIEGTVVVRFVVEKDGSVDGIRILRSVDINLDYEAIRVCKKLPKFIPGRKDGQVVRVWYALPIKFKLT